MREAFADGRPIRLVREAGPQDFVNVAVGRAGPASSPAALPARLSALYRET